MKRALFTIAIAAVALCGCDSVPTDDSIITPGQNQDRSVTFTPSITSATRVVSDLFENSDEIYVNAISTSGLYHASLIPYTYSNAVFVSDTPIIYDETNSEKLMFYAVYPATKSLASTFTFSAMTDQNSDDNYEMSDLLLSKSDYTTESSVDLAFKHMMTSIVVNITTPNMDGGVLTIYGATDAMIDVDNYSCVANNTDDTTTVAITPAYTTEGYKVILAPQTIAAGTVMATYEIGETTYEWTLDNSKTYASGCRYYVNWDLEENLVTFCGYISGWDDVTVDGNTDVPDPDQDDSYTDDPTISETDITFNSSASSFEIEVDPLFTSATSDSEWITISLSKGTLTIEVSENSTSTSERCGYVIIEGSNDYGNVFKYEIAVHQSGADVNVDDTSVTK